MNYAKEMNLKKKDSVQDKKACTTCLQEFPSSSFYSKGNRLDSVCKICKKQKSKTTYLRDKKSPPLKELNQFINLMKELNIKTLDDFDNKLKNIIERNENEYRTTQKAA